MVVAFFRIIFERDVVVIFVFVKQIQVHKLQKLNSTYFPLS